MKTSSLLACFAALLFVAPTVADEPDAVVALDGSGDYTSIQAAVMKAPYHPEDPPWVIQVKPGTYKENVYVQRERGYLRLVGEDPETTTLTSDLNAHMPGPDGKPIGTFRTPTLRIDGDGFQVENMTIENSAGPVGQALALRVDGDRAVFRNCRLLGWQDTILVNRGRQYFVDCRIDGHVDFIFGGATSFFDNCHIHCLRNGYITAASTPPDQAYGLVFKDCKITGEPDVQTFLGRPWRPYGMTIWVDCEMSDVVRPEGWNNWGKESNEETARYAEHGTTGDGAKSDDRVGWAGQLTEDEAAAFTVDQVLAGADGWNPAE